VNDNERSFFLAVNDNEHLLVCSSVNDNEHSFSLFISFQHSLFIPFFVWNKMPESFFSDYTRPVRYSICSGGVVR